MTSGETTPSPNSAPAHVATGGEYGETGETGDELGRGSTADPADVPIELPPDGGPAPAGVGGPTAAEDAPVLLPVDPPDNSDDDRVEASFDGRGDERADEDGVLPGEDRPAPDDGGVSGDHSDGLPTPVPASGGSGLPSSPIGGGEGDWHELQSRFVDDPEAAVRDAGALVEKAVSDLRERLETGDTESLRKAFKRYRDLYAGLS